jgi:rare lipoprotein A (peptidoglycan hydrolase)
MKTENIINWLVAFTLFVAIIFIAEAGIENGEKNECRNWKPEEITQSWQVAQCARYEIPIVTPEPVKTMQAPVETMQNEDKLGSEVKLASWYDYDLPGNPDYSETHRTAASRDYPRGTMLKVCEGSIDHRCVEVLVNDYGPDKSVHPDRAIDLSSYAFSRLYPLEVGVIQVTIEPIIK